MLRLARENRQISLEQLAQLAHVPTHVLSDLEKNDFSQLPPAVYVQGYIKTCGRILGFDAAPLLGLLRRDYQESREGTLLPASLLKPVRRKKFNPGPGFWAGAAVGLVGLILAGYISMQFYRLARPPQLILNSPLPNAAVAATVEVKGKTDPDVVIAVNAASVPVQPDGEFSTQVEFTTPGVNFIEVKATNRRGKTSSELRSVSVSF